MPVSSERPRDRLGRPVPAGDDRVFPSVPERDFVSSEDAWSEGMEYLGRDLPFHVHEVFEQRWRCAPESERSTWQALAQWGQHSPITREVLRLLYAASPAALKHC